MPLAWNQAARLVCACQLHAAAAFEWRLCLGGRGGGGKTPHANATRGAWITKCATCVTHTRKVTVFLLAISHMLPVHASPPLTTMCQNWILSMSLCKQGSKWSHATCKLSLHKANPTSTSWANTERHVRAARWYACNKFSQNAEVGAQAKLNFIQSQTNYQYFAFAPEKAGEPKYAAKTQGGVPK